jgi:REP element-mobilizing transposase RayT
MFKNLPKFNDQSYVHYVTAKTFDNHKYFRNRECCLILRNELDFYRGKLGFRLLGYVIMPDHLHCLIWWDADKFPELTISKIMQGIKSHSAKEISYYLQTGRRKPSLSPYSSGASEGSRLPQDYQWINS